MNSLFSLVILTLVSFTVAVDVYTETVPGWPINTGRATEEWADLTRDQYMKRLAAMSPFGWAQDRGFQYLLNNEKVSHSWPLYGGLPGSAVFPTIPGGYAYMGSPYGYGYGYPYAGYGYNGGYY